MGRAAGRANAGRLSLDEHAEPTPQEAPPALRRTVVLEIVGMGLILISLAEMIGAKSGLGYMMWNAWEILSVETMYVGLLVIAALGVLFTVVLNQIERYLVPWKAAR